LNSGAAIIAKFLMRVLKKLHSPTKDRIGLISVGGFAFLMAFNLLLPGLMPAGVKSKT
jgi:hypothetical protein